MYHRFPYINLQMQRRSCLKHFKVLGPNFENVRESERLLDGGPNYVGIVKSFSQVPLGSIIY